MELDDADAAVASFRPQKWRFTAYQLWEVQKLCQNSRKEYLDHWEGICVTGRPVDILIYPTAPFTATPHGKNKSVPVIAE
jgi:amidase